MRLSVGAESYLGEVGFEGCSERAVWRQDAGERGGCGETKRQLQQNLMKGSMWLDVGIVFGSKFLQQRSCAAGNNMGHQGLGKL
jgi:hypothetical protein